MLPLSEFDCWHCRILIIFQEVMWCKCSADSQLMEIATKLVLLMLSKLPLDVITNDYLFELSLIVSLCFCHIDPFCCLRSMLVPSIGGQLNFFCWLDFCTVPFGKSNNLFEHVSFYLGGKIGTAICPVAQFAQIWSAPPTIYHPLVKIFGMQYSLELYFYIMWH